jgi:2-hydroxychromene-2-carboxylate isomerase
MPSRVDIFWSFRSPYSYLATSRLIEIAKTYDVDMQFRPVLPMAIRTPDKFGNPMAIDYIRMDAERVAAFLGADFSFPNPDPVAFEAGTMRATKEQPYIYRLSRLGVAASEQGRGFVFAREISCTIWGGKIQDWSGEENLRDATKRAGLDLASLETSVAGDVARYDQVIAANGDALAKSGHWGVPTCVFEGEPFFGQDRLDVLCWRLDQRGLRGH